MAGRFAPTPTSDLHVGNLRTALVAWLAARAAKSDFLVRIEDLDLTRLQGAQEYIAHHLADLASLGLTHDGAVVRQSERSLEYEHAVAQLETYECFCSRKDVQQATMAPHGSTRFYPGTCAHLTPAERAELRKTKSPSLRVRAHGQSVTIHDQLVGRVTGVVDDFVVRRADGIHAYNLAVVVDDALQGVDHVVRGDDLLESAPRQAWLATRLGFLVPEYLHVPLVYNRDGTRLAKRHQAIGLRQLARRGVSPNDVIDILAWSLNLADKAEHITLPELVSRFSIERLPREPWFTDPDAWPAHHDWAAN